MPPPQAQATQPISIGATIWMMASYGLSALASAGSARRYVMPSEFVADWKVIPVSTSTNDTESDCAEAKSI